MGIPASWKADQLPELESGIPRKTRLIFINSSGLPEKRAVRESFGAETIRDQTKKSREQHATPVPCSNCSCFVTDCSTPPVLASNSS